MNPKASRAAVAGAQSVLSQLASFLLERADGSRSVDELRAQAASVFGAEPSREATFRALDELSDHGLLEARLAPPAGRPLTRRALGFATAAAAAALLMPSVSQARLPAPQKGADKEKFAESEAKKADKGEKHAEKEAKKAEKHAEKEAKKAEKHAESEAKKAAESEAKKAEKAAESEAKKMKHAESEAKKVEKAAESEAKKSAESEAKKSSGKKP